MVSDSSNRAVTEAFARPPLTCSMDGLTNWHLKIPANLERFVLDGLVLLAFENCVNLQNVCDGRTHILAFENCENLEMFVMEGLKYWHLKTLQTLKGL